MDNQISLSDLSTHTKRMDTLQWAGEHATARYERETMRALEQEEREERRERSPAFLEELIEAMRRLQVMAEARAEVEKQMEVETPVEVEGRGAKEVDGDGGETKMAESTHDSSTRAPVLAPSGSCARSSTSTRRDLSISIDSKAKATNDHLLLDKKVAVSESKVNVKEEEKVEERNQSWAMMTLTHDDDCWVKPDRSTGPWCPCQMVNKPSDYS